MFLHPQAGGSLLILGHYEHVLGFTLQPLHLPEHQYYLAASDGLGRKAAYSDRARNQDSTTRRAHRCIEAVQEATRLGAARGWVE